LKNWKKSGLTNDIVLVKLFKFKKALAASRISNPLVIKLFKDDFREEIGLPVF
jgi:hypothetical protein